MVDGIKKIICDQKSVELCFLEHSFVHVIISKNCETIALVLEKNSRINMVVEFDPDHEINVVVESVLHENSSLEILPIYFTNKSISQTWHFFLKGNKSSMNLKGLAVLCGQNKVKIETSQRHQGIGTHSAVEILSLLQGSSSFDYEGIIHIEKQASETRASQQNKNILLSATSLVRSVPTIEVLNKNVQCSHGSAMGSFDKDQLYYLKSRGLDQSNAEKILIDSFCDPVINEIPWKEKLKFIIQQKLV